MDGYKEGDDVIVYLSTKTRDVDESEYRICKVIAVGIYDLICETPSKFSKVFRVSKKRCVKLNNKYIKPLDHHPTKPKLGDLVTSIRDTFSTGRDQFTGIVEDIIYDPTSNSEEVYIVRIGSKTVRAYLENIIIIETVD